MVSKLQHFSRKVLSMPLFTTLLILITTNLHAQYLADNGTTNKRPIVVIDPGHGGKDKGCHSDHYMEKDVCLEVSKALALAIQKADPNIQVVLTRTVDQFVSLGDRAELANVWNADLFLSIHANAIDLESIRGSETFVFGDSETHHQKMVAQRENASLIFNQDASNSSIESFILNASNKSDALKKSIKLAELIEGTLEERAGHKSRGVKQSNFMVLKELNVPAVLVETGYLTNARDRKCLTDGTCQEEIASKIATAVKAFLKNQSRL